MVHQYKLNGYNIVLDSCSGAVHAVDEVAYDMIALFPELSRPELIARMLEKYAGRPDVTEEELALCYEDIQALKDAGKLYSEDQFEELAGNCAIWRKLAESGEALAIEGLANLKAIAAKL